MTEADIPHRDQIARIIGADENIDNEGDLSTLAAADALLREFDICPRPGKEPRT